MELVCIICGNTPILIDHRNGRGWCPEHRRQMTLVTVQEWLDQWQRVSPDGGLVPIKEDEAAGELAGACG